MNRVRNRFMTRWFLLFFTKSISQRKGRLLIASVSVTLAVAVVTGMIGLTLGISEKLGRELRAYGANIVVSPQKGDYLKYDTIDAIAGLQNVEEVTGQVFTNAIIQEQSIELIGLEIDTIKDRGWKIIGNWPEQKAEILAGINLKNALALEAGKTVRLASDKGRMDFMLMGFIEKGGMEDNAFLVSLSDAWEFIGRDGRLDAVLVRGKAGELEDIVRYIRAALPHASVKTLRQVAVAEESLLRKIQLLMAFVTVVVLFASVISVASTMGANVLERREEIGLMKAIGATKGEISRFYQAEAVLTGLSGGSAGYLIAYLSAQAISFGAFGSLVAMPLYLLFVSLLIGLAIAVLASHFPVQGAMKQSPAVILRGE